MSVWNKGEVPWNGPDEWIVWLVLLIIATFLIHNGQRAYKRAKTS